MRRSAGSRACPAPNRLPGRRVSRKRDASPQAQGTSCAGHPRTSARPVRRSIGDPRFEFRHVDAKCAFGPRADEVARAKLAVGQHAFDLCLWLMATRARMRGRHCRELRIQHGPPPAMNDINGPVLRCGPCDGPGAASSAPARGATMDLPCGRAWRQCACQRTSVSRMSCTAAPLLRENAQLWCGGSPVRATTSKLVRPNATAPQDYCGGGRDANPSQASHVHDQAPRARHMPCSSSRSPASQRRPLT